MRSKLSGQYIPAALIALVVVLGALGTVQAADANLYVQFTTTNPGGNYSGNVHVVWLTTISGGFVATVGTTTTDNKRAVWANSQADELDEWYTTNLPTADRTADIAARTGATQSSYQTYTFNWNWRDTDGTTIPDGTYQLHFLVTNSNDPGIRNHAVVNNVVKGTSAWSYGPTSQNGYNNISLNFTPAGLGVTALPATNVGSASATLNGEVTATDPGGSNPDVYIYYGDNDAGTIASNWDYQIDLGTSGVGPFSADVINLTPVTTYYYRCRVVTTSPAKDIWSGLISFTTTQPESAHINVTSETINFGQVPVNDFLDIDVAVQNSGKLPLEIHSLEFVGLESDAYSLVPAPVLPLMLNAYQPPTWDTWSNQDIGSVGAAGSVVFDGDLITVKGSGADIWGDNDEFHFVYQAMTGDGQIIARVDSIQNTNEWAKAGVMMRNSLGSDEVRNVYMAMTPSNGTTFQWRSDEETYSSHTTTHTVPYWVKLVRSGNTYAGYYSPNGVTWTQEGTSQTFSMNSTLYVGLAVTSHNDGTLCEAVFSNISGDIEKPSDEVIDEETLTVRFVPRSVQDYKYARLAIGSNDPDKITYVDLQGSGGPDAEFGTRQVGGVGGAAKAVAKYGDNNILLGQGAMLVLVDVSNPSSPSKLNQIRLDGVIEAITVQGDTAYAALGNKGFAVVDLKDFTPLGGAETIQTSGFASDIDSEGTFLCIADGIAGTHLYDISLPLEPIFVKTHPTSGSVSSVYIINGFIYILDESEGLQIFTPDMMDVVGHWKFNESAGSVASDASSNGYHGTLVNMDNSAWVTGKKGNALDFDGVDDYVEIPGFTGIPGSTSRTCSAWIKTNLSGAIQMIMSWGASAVGQAWMIYIDSNGKLACNVYGGNVIGTSTLNDDSWHHVTVILGDDLNADGRIWVEDIRLYVDGVIEPLSAINAGSDPQAEVNTTSEMDVTVGVRNYGQLRPDLAYSFDFDGLIDDVRIYDEALASGDINHLMSQLQYEGVEFGTRIKADNTTAYAVDSFGILSVLDAAEDVQMQSEMLLQIGSAMDVGVQSGYVYVIGQAGLEALDVSNPAGPTSVFVDPNILGYNIVVDGSVAYLSAGLDGLEVLDISNPAAISLLGSYSLMSASSGVASGDFLGEVYVIGNEQELVSYDLSASAAPIVNDTYESLFHAEDVEIRGQYAFVAAGLAGFNVFDLSNPAGAPATLPTGRFASAVSANDSKAMVCDSNDIYVVDISSPMLPSLIGTMSTAGWASDVAVGSTHGYIAEGGMGISILNLSDAQAVGSYSVAGLAYGVAVDGNVLYVACGTAGVTILDVSNPAGPLLIAEYDLPGVIVDVAKVGDKLCVADSLYGVSVLNVSNPATPVLYANAATNSPSFHVSSAGSRILVADRKGGLAVLGVTDWPKNTIGDISNDYRVGLDDLVLLAARWLSVESGLNALPENLNYYDTFVNMQDFSVLSYYWQAQYENLQGLVAHWKFNEATGSLASDSSPNSYDGTLVAMDNSDWVAGKTGNALDFDGIDDYVRIINCKGVTGTSTRTCTAWIKTSLPSREILTWGEEYSGGRWVIRVNEGGQLRVEVQGGNIIGSTPINDGVWHHVAVVITDDGSPNITEAQLYVDGQLETISASVDEPIHTGSLYDVQIGAYVDPGAPRWFQGQIDEVRIYNRALTEQEIQGLSQ